MTFAVSKRLSFCLTLPLPIMQGGEDMAHGEDTTPTTMGGESEDMLFVAPPRDGTYKTFGREGTRSA